MALTDRAYVAEIGTPLPKPSGPIPRWIRVVATEEAGENVVGKWALIRANPTNGDIQAITQPNALWADVAPWLAPLIKEWNVTVEEVTWRDIPAVLAEDGTEVTPARRVAEKIDREVPLPAPAEAGGDVLLRCEPDVRNWLHEQCILARLHVLAANGETEKNAAGKSSPAPSGSPPDGTPDGETTSTPMNGSHPRRKSSSTR